MVIPETVVTVTGHLAQATYWVFLKKGGPSFNNLVVLKGDYLLIKTAESTSAKAR